MYLHYKLFLLQLVAAASVAATAKNKVSVWLHHPCASELRNLRRTQAQLAQHLVIRIPKSTF